MPDFIALLLTVPTITAFIGYVTNWAAVKMIFHPARFVGIGPFGWQGILYKQVHKFANNVADMATSNLLTARDIAERVDPDELERMFEDVMAREAEVMCAEAAEIIRPGAWQTLPAPVREMTVAQVRTRTRAVSREIFAELRERADELIDLRTMVYQQLSGENAGRLADMTHRIGHKEFRFIEYYGGVFGFLVGCVQIGVWSAMQIWWLMPMVGVAVGLGTNWLAIQMIFRPQQPRRYLGVFPYQGLFAKRQPEISADYGAYTASELLTPGNIIRILTEGEAGRRVAATVSETLSARIDQEWQKVSPMVPVAVGDDDLARIKAAVVARVSANALDAQPRVEAYLARVLEVEKTVTGRLASLSKPEFERILRGVFEEDEITLILVGGFLGGCVGALQGAIILAM